MEIVRGATEDAATRRLLAIPGMGPLIATALVALAPPAQTFRPWRDLAAWPGLTRRQHWTRGKQRLGATTRTGERSPGQLAILGANSVVIKRHVQREVQPGI